MGRSELNQTEAYCLMLYRNEETGREEWLWNSRDGVTPFCINDAEDGGEMKHIDWFRDVFAPFHVPPVGSRIFVSFTETRSRIVATENFERAVANGYCKEDDREEFVESQTKDIFRDGCPDILTVNSAMQEEYRARKPAPRPTPVRFA